MPEENAAVRTVRLPTVTSVVVRSVLLSFISSAVDHLVAEQGCDSVKC